MSTSDSVSVDPLDWTDRLWQRYRADVSRELRELADTIDKLSLTVGYVSAAADVVRAIQQSTPHLRLQQLIEAGVDADRVRSAGAS